jgi:hypothetical protein
VEGNEVVSEIPHIEKPNDLGMDGVGPTSLIEGKEEIIEVPPIKIDYLVVGTPLLDQSLIPDII